MSLRTRGIEFAHVNVSFQGLVVSGTDSKQTAMRKFARAALPGGTSITRVLGQTGKPDAHAILHERLFRVFSNGWCF